MDIRPDYAVVIRDGHEEKVSPDEVAVGETIIIRPGEKIPLDGVITEGSSSVNTAALTGESAPVDLGLSDTVISGTLNLTGVIMVKTTSEFGQSTVSKILELVENASDKKAKVETYWIEKDILVYLRRYLAALVMESLDGYGETDYRKEGEGVDRIYGQLYFATKNITISSVASVKEFLSLDNVKKIAKSIDL
jgi:Cd2+/Zn2+-exporting ATPase